MPLTSPLACFATTTPGVETLLAGELRGLGLVPGKVEPGGVEFQATPRELASALLWLRTANRVTVRLAVFTARTFAELERHAAKVSWSDVIVPDSQVHFRVTSKKSKLYHDNGIAERLERVVMAAVPRVTAVRASSAAEALEENLAEVPPVQRIVVRLLRDEVTLSADASGALLYRRGYRQAVAKAPMRETLAASLLLAGGWEPSLPLLDPMCGSGTIPIEAALMARRMAPGRARSFAAQRWPGFAPEIAAVRAEALAGELSEISVSIAGSDRDAGAVEASMANAKRAGVLDSVGFARMPLTAMEPDSGRGMIVTNPPYGARIGDGLDLRDLYAAFGRVVRERRPGWGVALIGADRALEGQLGGVWREVLRTTNGGLPIRLLRHDGRSG